MATPNNKVDQVAECPAETMREIGHLLRQLFDIYTQELPELLPSEALQLTQIYILFNPRHFAKLQDQGKLADIQRECARDLLQIYDDFAIRITTFREHQDVFKAFKFDTRFANQTWYDNPYFELLKRLYYLVRMYSLKILYALDGIDNQTRQKMHFYVINFLNFFAPTNYIWTNPEVIEAMIESGGSNLLKGIKNYLEDLVLNDGRLNVRMTDTKAFKVGENLAITPGKVVYQNDLIQLIQYAPTTAQVQKFPILFTPPWINKYYVLDLSEKNSMVRWLVEQGFTVFMISWVNPDESFAEKKFADYMLQGPLAAVDFITKELQIPQVHMVGYCIGGTLLACTLAYMLANNDQRAKSSTFFMSLLNFSNPGEIGVFLDEPQLNALELVMKEKGYLNGHLVDIAFNTLRPNELIWPYVINNYLLGKPSRPFDLLFWNSDSTNQPYQMYNFYLRNMYLHNNLRKPGAITLNNTPIDLGLISTPSMFVASETDHITLWRSIYSGIHLLNCPAEFVLSESGHVRAVVNPPGNDKYGYSINPSFNTSGSFNEKSKEWLEGSHKHSGSWWPYWVQWLLKQDDKLVPARDIKTKSILEDAPGSYVKRRI